MFVQQSITYSMHAVGNAVYNKPIPVYGYNRILKIEHFQLNNSYRLKLIASDHNVEPIVCLATCIVANQ